MRYINLLFYFTFAVIYASIEHLHKVFKTYTEKVSEKSPTSAFKCKMEVFDFGHTVWGA